jgi:hypothetical protein
VSKEDSHHISIPVAIRQHERCVTVFGYFINVCAFAECLLDLITALVRDCGMKRSEAEKLVKMSVTHVGP